MTEKIKSLDEIFAKYIIDLLPEAERDYLRLSSSSVEVSVWLVGLATGVVVLLMSNSTSKEILEPWAYQGGVIIFSLVVLCGVTQRIIFHIAELKKWPLSQSLRGCLIGYTDNVRTASELQEFWTVEDIVNRLRDDFGVNYEYLLENEISLARAREAYISQMEIHRKFEEKGLATLSEIICAHHGLSKETEENYFGQKKINDLNDTRVKAVAVNKVYNMAYIAYYLTSALFVLGVVTLALGTF